VAVKDHEHFRLKLVYSRKKKIQNNLREAEVRMQIYKVSLDMNRIIHTHTSYHYHTNRTTLINRDVICLLC